MTVTSWWKRVSRSRPCLICGRPDWCGYSGPDDDPTAFICARVESEKRCGEAGCLHVIREDPSFQPIRRFTVSTPAPPKDFSDFTRRCCASLSSERRNLLAQQLGISSLSWFAVGWSARHRAFTFPMVASIEDRAHGPVCGVRLRAPDGRKWSVKGSKNGLFVPIPLLTSDRLLICEGPTDAAAMCDLRFAAVGRPSCAGGVALLVPLVQRGNWDEVVIVADADGPGHRGAQRLASSLIPYALSVRIITPPAKDAREWVRQGATHDDVIDLVESAPALHLNYAVEVVR